MQVHGSRFLILAAVALLVVAPAMAAGPSSSFTQVDADLNAFASGSFTSTSFTDSSFFSGSEFAGSQVSPFFFAETSPFFAESGFTTSFTGTSAFASPSLAFTASMIDLRWTANAGGGAFTSDSQFSEFAASSEFAESQFAESQFAESQFSAFAGSDFSGSEFASSEFSAFSGTDFDASEFTQSNSASPIELITP